MTTVVEATVPTDRFALGDTFDTIPDVVFEPVRITATADSAVMPFLWASAPDLDGLHDAIRGDPTVKDGQWITRHGEHDIYHIEWEAPIRRVIAAIIEEQGTVLHSRGTASCWEFKLLFRNRTAVSTAYDRCRERGVTLGIRRIYEMDGVIGSFDNRKIALTDKQYEALTTAFKLGYYRIPRQLSLMELAETLGVSHQSLSERMRRIHQTLISTRLGDQQDAIESASR